MQRPPTPFFLALCLVATLTVSACATQSTVTPSRAVRDTTAALEVTNRTGLDWQISRDGWALGIIQSGERKVFRYLRPGSAKLTAWSDGYRIKRQSVQLSGQQPARWALMPPAGIQPLDIPPPFGSITLHNASAYDLEVQIDGGLGRDVLAGDEQTVHDVLAGKRTLTVAIAERNYRRTHPIEVLPNGQARIEVPVETGRVDILNQTGEPVRLFVNGVERGSASHDQANQIDGLLVGLHSLRALGVNTGKEMYYRPRVRKDAIHRWDLTSADGRLEVNNQTGETVRITVESAARGELKHTKTAQFEDVALGLRLVVCEGVKTGYRWTATIPISAGHRVRWTLRDDVATLRVKNELNEPIEVRVRKTRVARLGVGESRFLDQLQAGKSVVEIRGERSQTLQSQTIELTPERSAAWVVQSPQARVHVRNGTAESVLFYADQVPLGRVPSGGEIIFTQVPPGDRLLEARGELSGEVTRAERTLDASDIVVWDVAQDSGEVEVDNQSGEVLLVPPALRPQGKQIAAGAKRRFLVGVGRPMLHFLGKRSGQSYFKRVTVHKAAVTGWTIGALTGLVELYNRTAEEQVVSVDDEAPVPVPAGKVVSVELAVGPHRLVAVGADSDEAVAGTVVVRGRAVHPWEIRRRLAYVRIVNNTSEALDLRRGDEVLGYVDPGSMRTYGPWQPNDFTLVAQGRWSRAIYERSITLLAGRVESWDVEPARGAILVQNDRDEATRVLVDRKQVATVAAQGQLRLELPLGPHLVELIGQRTHAVFTERLRVRPDRTYSLVAPKGPAMLVVKNGLPIPLSLQIDGLDRGSVEPNAELRIPIPRLGKATVHATGPDGRLTWHRRVTFDQDRIVRWEILP